MGERLRKNETVLITGASSGIGYELSKIFAREHYDLVLVARRIEKLEALKAELLQDNSIQITLIEKDLSLKGAAKEVYDFLMEEKIEIDILVNNAGIGACGIFHEIEEEKDEEMIKLNITSLTKLTKLLIPQMIKRKKGSILNVGSTGSYQPGPLTAVYYATKAYVLSFSEAIREELKPYGIKVSVLCPGATKTEFASRAGKGDPKVSMSPKEVALCAYKGLLKGKRVIVPGMQNKIALLMTRSLPRSTTARLVQKWQKAAMEQKNPHS